MRSALSLDETTGVVVDPPPSRPKPPPLPGAGLRARGKKRQPRATDQAGSKRRRRVSVAWFLLLFVGAAGALVGVWGYEKYRAATEGEAAAMAAVDAANERAAESEARALDASAALTRERGERERVEKDMLGVKARAAKADELESKLKEIVGDEGTIVRDDKTDRVTLELVDKVLFPSGQASLTPRGEKVLTGVGEVLRQFPEKQVWVQGHTDDAPIKKSEFASNWELSSARALTVVYYLQDVAGVDPRRLAAVGFGEHRPVSRSKKFKNRRIEIVLFPREVQLIRD